ncbi:hypothetical protein X566_24540 [Afipia sp. P52-10]|uniref:hypothetical protein n=1 Tax=Afipia sp. P52-10 TaxID=1429916 RepID=UPI0003DF2713|nr:hypothetical protein [Afipia sp. P52-10]ETR76003.1 hypothetical protein X566_24540 [Afipia sp. P52-10]
MRSIVWRASVVCACGMLACSPLHAQSNSSIRPNADRSVTTGIGTSSTFRVEPPNPTPPPDSRPSMLYWQKSPMFEDDAKDSGRSKDDGKSDTKTEGAATPPPAAVPENPRTTITRDRIESPQH